MSKKELPEMFVEERVSTTPHDVPAPDTSEENMDRQVNQAMQMNEDAKSIHIKHFLMDEVAERTKDIGWKQTTLDILQEYMPIECTDCEIKEATKEVFGMNGMDEVAFWVRDDMCSEFFNYALKYCLRMKQEHRDGGAGFIDGSGIGYLNVYLDDLKIALEKTFDTKWYYKVLRPLEYVLKNYGIDLSITANAMHPGHWAYVQGHYTKAAQAVGSLDNRIFNLDAEVKRKLVIAASVFGHARDSNFIHNPFDCEPAVYNTTLVYE